MVTFTPMLTIHNFIKQMDVDVPTASDFTSMTNREQYAVARQGPLEGRHQTQSLRTRLYLLREYQDRVSNVGPYLRDELDSSIAEFRKWHGK